jgi:hypothetical protein
MHSLFTAHALPELTRAISLHRRKLVAESDPDNAGVLIVQLGGRKSSRRAAKATRRLGKSNKGYVAL